MLKEDEGRERKKGEATPLPKDDTYIYRCPIEQDESRYCPTTFSCTVFIGLSVMRFTDSRLLSSAMLA